jgi:hypothetical protein
MTLYWCDTCNAWNATHQTAEHVSRNPKKQANIVDDSPAAETVEVPPDIPSKKTVSFYGSVARRMAGE